MNLQLQGKIAMVAASSKGLGYGIAFELAKEGANLSIYDPKVEENQIKRELDFPLNKETEGLNQERLNYAERLEDLKD